jgi:hypothetical protein
MQRQGKHNIHEENMQILKRFEISMVVNLRGYDAASYDGRSGTNMAEEEHVTSAPNLKRGLHVPRKRSGPPFPVAQLL